MAVQAVAGGKALATVPGQCSSRRPHANTRTRPRSSQNSRWIDESRTKLAAPIRQGDSFDGTFFDNPVFEPLQSRARILSGSGGGTSRRSEFAAVLRDNAHPDNHQPSGRDPATQRLTGDNINPTRQRRKMLADFARFDPT